MTLATSRHDVVVVLNGISPRKRLFYQQFLPVLKAYGRVRVEETLRKDHAMEIASAAADTRASLIIAAGGDGTLNQVVNGVLSGRETQATLPVIGLIPLGSGNDFARTVHINQDPARLGQLLSAFTPKAIDVGAVRLSANPGQKINPRYFVNVADIGMGPVVVDKVARTPRWLGGGIAYYKSILSTFFSWSPAPVHIKADDWCWEGRVRTVAIANGKYYGHGLCICPDALIDDQKLSVFICGNVSALDFIRHSSTLKKGRHVRHQDVHYKTARSLTLSSRERCFIETDGEVIGALPASVGLAVRSLAFLI